MERSYSDDFSTLAISQPVEEQVREQHSARRSYKYLCIALAAGLFGGGFCSVSGTVLYT
jgi:uncharacterized membrane protein YjjP (DUF1212 family)